VVADIIFATAAVGQTKATKPMFTNPVMYKRRSKSKRHTLTLLYRSGLVQGRSDFPEGRNRGHEGRLQAKMNHRMRGRQRIPPNKAGLAEWQVVATSIIRRKKKEIYQRGKDRPSRPKNPWPIRQRRVHRTRTGSAGTQTVAAPC